MGIYMWCSVLCQLWLLPSWISSKTVPEVAGEKETNSTSRPDILESSTVFSVIERINETENYETTSAFSTDSSYKPSILPKITKKFLTQTHSTIKKNSSLWDLTTNPLPEAENITGFIDKMTENKSSTVDYTKTVSSGNSTAATVANKDTSLNAAGVSPRLNSVSPTTESDIVRENTSMVNTAMDLDSNKTTVNITAPLDINVTSKAIPHSVTENNTSTNNSTSLSPSTTFHSVSTSTVASSSNKRKPFPWTTPHPNVVRNMWLAKRARSRTHTGSLHHLSLVPIEDGPFGSLIWKDKKYLITVLVPIGIGIIGAVCIISMAYVVRFCHRNERKMQEIRETIQKRYSNQNDQVILLTNSSDDEF
ncbi:mucin-21-like [Argopecten irradians]|uniref:mucin-21-like n=1 Tax=Argopecten irradians TaxID=31199 RepID=UPI003712D3AA